MPLVKVSVQQLEAAQRLYEAATYFITNLSLIIHSGETFIYNDPAFVSLVAAVTKCKEEYEKHGCSAFTQD